MRLLWQDWQRCADGLWAADKLGGSGRMSKRDAPEANGAPDSESKKRSCRAAKMKVCASRPECGIACVRGQSLSGQRSVKRCSDALAPASG